MKKKSILKAVTATLLVALMLSLLCQFDALKIKAHGEVDIESRSLERTQNSTYAPVEFTRNGMAMYRKGAWVNGHVYVPLYWFVKNFTSASYTYTNQSVTVYGQGLTVSATIGTPYLLANDRVIYTGLSAMGIDGNLWVPLEGLAKALGIAWKVEKDGHVSLSGNYRPILRGEAFYREDEVYWLSKIISAESKGEPLLGQIAVGCVILNRVKSPLFPSTIYSVIFDKKYGVQFTPTANGTIYQKPYDISVIAAKICLEGYDMGNILYFYHPVSSASTNWISQNRKFAFTIGGHRFYY